jgi:hypothetical protein
VSAAREFWKRIETLHAVTYFAEESRAAATEAGLRGFWMGYFGFRAAPLGAVTAGAVEAVFANFAPTMVRRSLPDAWHYAQPADLIMVRARSSAAALRRLWPDIDALAHETNTTLASIAAMGAPIGRPLFSANRDIARFDDPVEQLWQHCTTLREHRGDGHVGALAAAGVDGCEAHLVLIADRRLPAELFRDSRGWSAAEWDDATVRLRARGLLHGEELSDAGRRLRADVEKTTDARAMEPISLALDAPAIAELIAALTPAANALAASGTLPFPNPMGLPELQP